MAEVHLDRVGKVYADDVRAVRDISFAVPDRGFCVLVGPSGCGKSTLLRMIAGLETISEGEVKIGGRVVNRVEPMDRDIAMVFQNYALYPHMSVYDNMAYGLRNRKTPDEEIKQRIAEAARLLQLEPFLSRKPRALSGGQRQRVAMGRAIVRQPQVFLFDEPLSNLDAKLRGQMRVEIKALQRRLGVTSIYVTHDQLEAMTLADMLVVMNVGKVEQIGDPLHLYEAPATLFVAQFIGAPPMNIIELAPGAMPSGIGGLEALPMPPAGAHLGIRAEHLALATNGGVPPGGIRLDLAVDAVEAVGAETYVHGRLSGSGRAITCREPGKVMIPAGTTRAFTAVRRDLHLFDLKTGQRLPLA
ncbi:MAG TPA: sn-glycerol-3-phosphate ABC transporter ATP-binding protein UgpC [Xanthobacteraceae bacterium]|nr:sn-glycerol-3-phosphate ABC transporter ATP-binding protein UgpC [Xanthobacteraceae bacterium]